MNPSLQHLAATILWSEFDNSTPSGDEPLDENYGIQDFDPESLAILSQKFQAFVSRAEAAITEATGSADWTSIDEFYIGPSSSDYQTEHDYIMTVNGHGCGFWEEHDWEPGVGTILTNLAKQDREIHAFAQDGKVYLEFC